MDAELIWATTLLVTYLIGILIFSPLLKKLEDRGFVGHDMYKVGNPRVPEMGGLGIAFAFLAGILFLGAFYTIPYVIYLIIFVLMFFFLFGLMDDLLGIASRVDLSHNKLVKVVIPLFFVYPLANYVHTNIEIAYIGNLEMGYLYPLLILPIYVMVTANLINMYSYYNGQSAGTTVIILIFVLLRLYSMGDYTLLYILFPFIGATMAFLSYNLQPAGVFPGDSGDMFMGSMIGIAATLGGLEIFVFIALLPLTINFLMFSYWFVSERGEVKEKFGKARDDGTINAPNPMTIMWLFPYYLRLTERQTTLIMFFLVFLSSLGAWFLC